MLKLPLKPLGEVAPLGDRRSCVTYMASITHDAEVQLRLPQILIGNERQLQAQLMRDLGELPANVHVWRQKSAWNCHASMRRYLSVLAKSLGNAIREKYVILLLDVARCHLDVSIVAHAKRCGVRLCFLPGHMTGDLQPCDTHLFSKFKAAFREKWRRQKAASANGFVTTQQWLQTVSSTIASVLPTTSWQQAFEATGVLAQQRRLSANLCQRLGWEQAPEVPAGPPCKEAAALIFPKRMKIDVLRYVLWQLKPPEKRKRLLVSVADAAPTAPLPRRRRLPDSFAATSRTPLTID